MGYYAEPEKPSLFRRMIAIVTLMAIIVITALVILLGYALNTTFDYNLASTPNFASLPAAARAAFGSAVSYTLTTYGYLPLIVIFLAVAGTVAAVFGLQSQNPGEEDFE